jgi:D-alanyl-D-alanine carboxypeptidase
MIKSYLLVFLLIIFNIGICLSCEFSTTQLPLSERLGRTFPAINSKAFVIVNVESGVVLHGKDFDRKNQNGESFYDICVNVGHSLLSKADNQRVIIFQDPSGYGCIFCYKNPDSCTFLCVLAKAESRQGVVRDIKLMQNWLNQFYLYQVSRRGEPVATIPVLYGRPSFISAVLPEPQLVLLSKNCDNNVKKILQYRTILPAPIQDGDEVGVVFYGTSTFQNTFTQKIKAATTVEKTGRIQVLCDSILYLIFGPRRIFRKED